MQIANSLAPEKQKRSEVWVYLLRCGDGTLYCGISARLEKRLRQHNGELPGGAKYTRGRGPVQLLAAVRCPGRAEALRLERMVKARPREEKLNFLQTYGAENAS